MNKAERLYRFGEIMSALNMLPELTMEDEVADSEAESAQEWVLPNLTKGLSDNLLVEALLCQIQREDDEAKFKLVALLTNSATRTLQACAESDTSPESDDINALALSANILWGAGQTKGLYQLLGLLSHVCTQFDMKIPTLATVFVRSNDGIENFGRLDPLSILVGKTTANDVVEAFQDGEE